MKLCVFLLILGLIPSIAFGASHPLSFSYVSQSNHERVQKEESFFSRFNDLFSEDDSLTVKLSESSGIDQVTVSGDLQKAIFLKTGFIPTDESVEGKILSVQGAFLYHGRDQSGLSYALYFEGYDRDEVGPFLNRLRYSRSTTFHKKSFSIDLLIPSAHAEVKCAPEPSDAEKILAFSQRSFQDYSSRAVGCIVGTFKGIWDSTGGAVAGLATFVASPVQSAKAVWGGAQRFWSGIQAFQKDVTGTMQRLYKNFQKIPPAKLEEIKCRIAAAIGTGVLVSYFTVGAGAPLVLLRISQVLSTLEKTTAFGPYLIPLKIAGKVKSTAIAVQLNRSAKAISLRPLTASTGTTVTVDRLTQGAIDIRRENPDFQVEAPEAIDPPLATAASTDDLTQGAIEIQVENPDFQVEAPSVIGTPVPQSLGSKLRSSGFIRDQSEPRPGTTNFSHLVAGTMPGKNGGRSLIIRRNGDGVFSALTDLDQGIYRGDPAWIIDGSGEKVAGFFGVRKIKPNLYTAPDATEANIIIERFNRGLDPDKRIPVTYYKPKDNRIGDQEYVDEFTKDELRLPLADSGTESTHDLFFHYHPNIYTPPELLVLHQQQMKILNEFKKFLDAKHSDLMPEIGLRTDFRYTDSIIKSENIVLRAAGVMDTVTSEPLMAFKRFRTDRYADAMTNPTFLSAGENMHEMLYGGASPMDVMKKAVVANSPEAKAAVEEFLAKIPKDSLAHRGLELNPEKIKDMISERIKFVNERARSLAP